MKQLLNFFNSMLKAQNFSQQEVENICQYFVSTTKNDDKNLPDIKFSISDLVYLGERIPSLNPEIAYNFLVYLLNKNKYDVLITFLSKVFISHIDKFNYTTKDVLRLTNLEKTFDRFVEFSWWAEIDFSVWRGAFFESLVASFGPLQNWKRPARAYLLDWLKKDEKGFYDFAFQNFSNYGIIVFNVLFEENVLSCVPKLLNFYLKNDFEEKRQVKNILKQHYLEVSTYVLELKKNSQIEIIDLINAFLIFSFKKEAQNVLSEIYQKEKDPSLKKLIVENCGIQIDSKQTPLAQAKKNALKYENNFNFLGFDETNFKPLVFQTEEKVENCFINYFLSSYFNLCSTKVFLETSFFRNLFNQESLNDFCFDVAQKLEQIDLKDCEWAFCLIAQNCDIKTAEKIISLFSKEKETKRVKLFVKLFVQIQKDEALDLFSILDKNQREQKIVMEFLLQGIIESEKYDQNTVEVLRDKIVPDFNLEDGKVKIDDYVLEINKDFSVSILGDNPTKQVLIEKKKLERELEKQTKRLKSFYRSGRIYTLEHWKKYILGNKLLHFLAEKLLWGRYSDGNLISVFKIEGEKITNLASVSKLDGDYYISIFHPVEYSELDWHYVFDAKSSPFNQLDVGIHKLSSYNPHSSVVAQFNGFMVNSKKFFEKMQEFGWKFGIQTVDKMVCSMTKQNKELEILAEICFDKALVCGETNISLGELRFYKLEDVLKTGNNFVTNKTKSQEIGALKPRYFSDVIYEVTQGCKK